MRRPAAAQSGIELPNQTLSSAALDLSRPEKHALVAFMRALTETVVAVPRYPESR